MAHHAAVPEPVYSLATGCEKALLKPGKELLAVLHPPN